MSRLTSTCAASLALTYTWPCPACFSYYKQRNAEQLPGSEVLIFYMPFLFYLRKEGGGGGGAYLRESYVLHLKYLHPNYRYRCMHAVTHITAYPILTFLCTYCKNRCMVVLSEFPKDF